MSDGRAREVRNTLTGEMVRRDGPVPVGDLLGLFPVSLLVSENREEAPHRD